MAGYSGKPLYQKLGLKPGMRCLPVNPPMAYARLVDGAEDVDFVAKGPADLGRHAVGVVAKEILEAPYRPDGAGFA